MGGGADREPDPEAPWIGVVVVTYRAADFIHECLESLAMTQWPRLKVVVVDNASPDDTALAVRDWASGARPFVFPPDWPMPQTPPTPKPAAFAEFDAAAAERAPFEALAATTLVHSGANLGFAGGVNVGLRVLRAHPEIGLFWVLNPDSVADPGAPAAYAEAARKTARFSLMGGRTLYYDRPDLVQSDGGRMRWWMGFGSSVNRGAPAATSAPPDPGALDYISGANMVASRAFLDSAGLMDADWFLYLEEVDWALRRGDLPLAVAPAARVFHRAGASAGSSRREQLDSPFSIYFSFRNFLRFGARWNRLRLPVTYGAALLLILKKFAAVGAWAQVGAAMRGLHGLPPPAAVRAKLSPQIWSMMAARPRCR